MADLPVDVLIPHGAEIHRIESSYGPLKEEIKCGLQGCRTPHGKGFVVAFSHPLTGDGIRFGIVGHVCGKSRFGTSWIEAERVFDAELRAAQVEAAMERFKIRGDEILPELWAALPRLEWQHRVRHQLELNAPELFRICGDAVRSQHGRLRYGGETILRLRGERFWTEDRAWSRALELNQRAKSFLDYAALPTAKMAELSRRIGTLADVEHQWALISDGLAAGMAALRPTHLDKVLRAVNTITGARSLTMGTEVSEWGLRVRVSNLRLEAWRWNGKTEGFNWTPIVTLAGSDILAEAV